jgi:hypothetical protein
MFRRLLDFGLFSLPLAESQGADRPAMEFAGHQ